MNTDKFTTHACEQVLRFTQTDTWESLSEEHKVQLSFNMGAMSLALNLNKEDGFIALANARTGLISMKDFRDHLKSVVAYHGVKVAESNISRQF